MTNLNYRLRTGERVTITDRTGETAEVTQTLDHRYIFAGRGRHTSRDASRINQIILHHTGFTARNDHRFDTVMAHYAVRLNGTILKLRQHTARLQASTNTRLAIDIEFEGNDISSREFRNYLNQIVRNVDRSEWVREFESRMGVLIDDDVIMGFIQAHAAANSRGVSRLPSALVPPVQQIMAGRLLVRFLTETVSSINHIYSHQQVSSHGNRANCPGPHIWFNVGYWAEVNLSLSSTGAPRDIPATIGRSQIGWEDERFRLVGG